MQDRNGGREMLVTELDLHWENEKKKKQGRLNFCSALCYLNAWN